MVKLHTVILAKAGIQVEFKSIFSLLSDPISFAQPKEIGERKGCPTPRPTATLRYSSTKASAELALSALKQSSTKSPLLIALLGVTQGDENPLSTTVII